MRLMIAMLVVWLFLFFNFQRWSASSNISLVACAVAAMTAVAIILLPGLQRLPLWGLLAAAVPAFLALKFFTGEALGGPALTLTVTEVSALVLTILTAHWISSRVGEFESAIARMSAGPMNRPAEPFSTSQAEMYREVRRARHHQRPLSLLAVEVDKASIQVALEDIVREAQQAMMKQYVLSDLARTLCDELEDYSIVARQDDHFLALLPEVTPEQLAALGELLRQVALEQTGVNLRIGTSSLTGEVYTFEALVDHAIRDMQSQQKTTPTLRPHQQAGARPQKA